MKWKVARCRKKYESGGYYVRPNGRRWLATFSPMLDAIKRARPEIVGGADTYRAAMAMCEAHQAATA